MCLENQVLYRVDEELVVLLSAEGVRGVALTGVARILICTATSIWIATNLQLLFLLLSDLRQKAMTVLLWQILIAGSTWIQDGLGLDVQRLVVFEVFAVLRFG